MEQFAKYVGVPGLLVIMVTGAMIGWVSFGIAAPPEVYTLLGAAWAYYFATNGKVITSELKERDKNAT